MLEFYGPRVTLVSAVQHVLEHDVLGTSMGNEEQVKCWESYILWG